MLKGEPSQVKRVFAEKGKLFAVKRVKVSKGSLIEVKRVLVVEEPARLQACECWVGILLAAKRVLQKKENRLQISVCSRGRKTVAREARVGLEREPYEDKHAFGPKENCNAVSVCRTERRTVIS